MGGEAQPTETRDERQPQIPRGRRQLRFPDLNRQGAQLEKQEIFFYSAGHKLKGYWYPPKAGTPAPAPGIVCCHGFSAMIETQLVGIPETLSEAGYGVVAFYCRGLGE